MNVARLDRFTAATSHVKHIRFIGGGAPIKKALDREYVEASLELSQPPRPPEAKAGPPLDASVLLSVDELKAVTGYAGAFTVERLPDLPQSPTYDSRHFRATDKPESFDAAVRVWRLAQPQTAEARYEAILREVPHAQETNEMGDRSLRGYDGRILAAAALDRTRGVVLELTCGADLCRDADQTAALLKRLLARDERLAKPAEGETEETP
jgi:hypothetical protein